MSLLNKQDERIKEHYKQRMSHYILFLKVPKDIYEFEFIDSKVLGIIEFQIKDRWVYLTSGMSEFEQPNGSGHRLELMCYTKDQCNTIPNLLYRLAEYPFKMNEPFYTWDTIPAPLNYLGLPGIYQGLILTPPQLENKEFGFFKFGDKSAQFLLVHPLIQDELEDAIEKGGQAIGEEVLSKKYPWLDFPRKSVLF